MTFKPSTAVYTPPETASYGKQAIADVKENERRGLGIGIADVRDYFAPVRPGQLAMLLAQTSNYKTGMLHFLETAAARQLMEQERDEILIHVSVEENIEEQAFLLLGRELGESAGKLARGEVQDWDKLEGAAIKIGTIPIYRIGESLARSDDFPNLTVSNMLRAIDALRSGKVTGNKHVIAGLFFDYLQAFPFDDEVKAGGTRLEQRRLQVRSDVYRLRKAAAHFNCPVWVAAQAKQTLTGSIGQLMLPGLYDGSEAKEIAERADRIVSQWMPKMSYPLGTEVKHNGSHLFTVEENLLMIKVLKQKPGLPSGKSWLCRIDFNKNLIAPITNERAGL
ncbi:MAG: hypothetical protein GY743_23520 [Planctomycetaceae bacterium]|nr:hypothetical protein [Planctomycetaceae bacterium]